MVAGTTFSPALTITPPGLAGSDSGSSNQAEYRGVFQDYVARSTEALSGQLDSFEGLLSQELQARVWLTLSYSLRLNRAWPSTRELLLMVAPKMERAGTWEDWLPCLARGIEKSQSIGDAEAEAELSLHLGHLLHRVGEPAGARKWLEAANRLFEELALPKRQAIALARLANLAYRAEADPAGAEDLLARALDLLDPTDPDGTFCNFVGGVLALGHHNLERATDYFLQARDLADRGNDRRLKALALLNLGRIYEQRGLFEPAETHFEWAIDAFSTIEDPVNLAVAYMNLGIVHMGCHDYDKALQRYTQAETVLRRCHGDRSYLAMVYNNQGMAYTEMAEWSRAEDAYVASINIWRELNNPLARLNVEDNLGDVYLRQDSLNQAADVFESALEELAQLVANGTISNPAECSQLRADLTSHLEQTNARRQEQLWGSEASFASVPA
jgi:tetratricopeptide (TPR) repeat protein